MRGHDAERLLLVDASVFITLAEIDDVSLLGYLRGEVHIPAAIDEEISDPPAADLLADADWISSGGTALLSSVQTPEMEQAQKRAEAHLGREAESSSSNGDIALLTTALVQAEIHDTEVVVLTDDKSLRKTCKTLSIPLSGSIGVVVRAVERGDLDATVAKEKLHAMDEVGARLSASLFKRAERLIDEAAKD